VAHSGIEEPRSLRAGLIAFSGVGGGEIAVGEAVGENCFGYFTVQCKALGLLVLLVPGEAEPAEALEDRLHAGVGVAPDIGVVEAQDHGAAVVAGITPVEDEGGRRAPLG